MLTTLVFLTVSHFEVSYLVYHGSAQQHCLSHNVSYQQIIQPETIINTTILSPVHCTSAYQTSFYPRTIKDWNQLPTHIIESNNLQSFLSQLTNYSLIY